MTDKDKIRNIIELFIAWNGETEPIDVANLDSAVDFINDSLQEEPISTELEEAAHEYAVKVYNDFLKDPKAFEEKDVDGLNKEIFKAGAMWQKEQEYTCYEEAFEDGASWKKEQMMANAIETTVRIDAGGYPYIPQLELYDYDKDIPLAKEGDKYKVVLIKENKDE